jgi:hypothetical protein
LALLALYALAIAPHAASAAKKPPPARGTAFLDNGVVKVGIDYTIGGAISYLSQSGNTTNLINTYDRGRVVQQSYYAGHDLDRRAQGQHTTWSPWPWNPIGAGDAYGNRATVLSSTITSTSMYAKTGPLLWDMRNERCQCTFETWVTLEGRRVRVHNKLTTARTDNRWDVLSRAQELPAAYPIANLGRVISYTGSQPFSGDPTSQILKSTTWIWSTWTTGEHWGACVNTSNSGVGVYTPGRTSFLGGLYGTASGDTRSSNTCYLAPTELVPLDKTSTFEYDYWLVVGSVDQIRQEVYGLHQTKPPPASGFPSGDAHVWNFDADGDLGGWTTSADIAPATVSGGALNGTATAPDPYLSSATLEKPAADSKVAVRLRNGTPGTTAQLFFTTAADNSWSEARSKRTAIVPDSDFTVYTFDMSDIPGWSGNITGLRLDPVEATGSFAIDWIRVGDF